MICPQGLLTVFQSALTLSVGALFVNCNALRFWCATTVGVFRGFSALNNMRLSCP